MARLFISLYLDEDVHELVADLLKARGFDVTTAQDVNNVHKSDAAQLAEAVSRRQILLTHNRVDFEALAKVCFATGQIHYGIIFAVRRSPQQIVQRLLVILNNVTPDEMQNQVRYI
jgi:predicted nuclease of predicted toxin-antitoxin system